MFGGEFQLRNSKAKWALLYNLGVLCLGILELLLHGHVVLDKLPVFQTLVSQSVKRRPHYITSAHRAKAQGMRTGPDLGLQITWSSQASPSSDALPSCNSKYFLHPLVTASLRCTVPHVPHLSILWNKRDPRVLREEELVFLPSTPPTELRILTYWPPETPTQSLGSGSNPSTITSRVWPLASHFTQVSLTVAWWSRSLLQRRQKAP